MNISSIIPSSELIINTNCILSRGKGRVRIVCLKNLSRDWGLKYWSKKKLNNINYSNSKIREYLDFIKTKLSSIIWAIIITISLIILTLPTINHPKFTSLTIIKPSNNINISLLVAKIITTFTKVNYIKIKLVVKFKVKDSQMIK